MEIQGTREIKEASIVTNEPKKPHNPGLSEQAWNKLHRMLAETNIKYQAEIAAGREAKEESAG